MVNGGKSWLNTQRILMNFVNGCSSTPPKIWYNWFWFTLWLCQNSYWKWPSRNSWFTHLPNKNGDFPVRKLWKFTSPGISIYTVRTPVWRKHWPKSTGNILRGIASTGINKKNGISLFIRDLSLGYHCLYDIFKNHNTGIRDCHCLSMFKWECHDHIASILVSFIMTYLVLVVTTFIDTNGTLQYPCNRITEKFTREKSWYVFQIADPILSHYIPFILGYNRNSGIS